MKTHLIHPKKLLVCLLLAFLLFILFSFNKRNIHPKNASKEIKIGFIGPLSGEAVSYGEPTKAGMEIAISEINKAGGITGKKVIGIYEDGKCNGKDAVAAAQKLISINKVSFIIGGTCSGETLAVAPLTEKANVILFSAVSSSPEITKAGDFVFRNQLSDSFSAATLAKGMFEKYGFKKVAFVSEATDYGKSTHEIVRSTFKQLGGGETFQTLYSPGTKDFKSTITTLIATKPDAININAQSPAAFLQFLKQARELGYRGEVFVPFLTGPEILKEKDLVSGIHILDIPDLLPSETNKKLIENRDKLYTKGLGYPNFTGNAFDAIYLLKRAIEENGEHTSNVRDYLYSLKNYSGTIGDYRFDSNGDVSGNIELSWKTIRDGKLVSED
jgi:branched-chain amino acid transport system substrate-binding protein